MIKIKICKGCLKEKPITEFYAHKEMKDGYLNFCKECVKKRINKHRIKNLEKIREYDRNRPNKNERYEKNKEYQKLHKETINKNKNEWGKKNKNKRYCHNAVKRAIKKGIIIKPEKCQICGKIEKLQAHHIDYTKPLNVIFLCNSCHKKEHKKINEIKRKDVKL